MKTVIKNDLSASNYFTYDEAPNRTLLRSKNTGNIYFKDEQVGLVGIDTMYSWGPQELKEQMWRSYQIFEVLPPGIVVELSN